MYIKYTLKQFSFLYKDFPMICQDFYISLKICDVYSSTSINKTYRINIQYDF